jgi:hypothetical protein
MSLCVAVILCIRCQIHMCKSFTERTAFDGIYKKYHFTSFSGLLFEVSMNSLCIRKFQTFQVLCRLPFDHLLC